MSEWSYISNPPIRLYTVNREKFILKKWGEILWAGLISLRKGIGIRLLRKESTWKTQA